MAADFNGTSSRLQHTTADLGVTTLMTLCAWVLADGLGEASFGTILMLDEIAPGNVFLGHQDAANTLRFRPTFTLNDGVWTIPATDGVWNAVAISYDGGSLLNDPVARVNFADVTETEVTAPTGVLTSPATGYCIGNNSAQSRTWDGMLAHVQVFNVILTAREMDQALRRPGSVRRGMKLWTPIPHAGYTADLSGNGFNATATSLTNRVGGPPCAPLFAQDYSLYAAVAAAAARQQTLTLLGLGA